MFQLLLRIIVVTVLPLTMNTSNQDTDHKKDLYFEVVEPFDISYTFRCRQAKDFGTEFERIYKNIYLMAVKPFRACSRLHNAVELKGNIAFIERGDCSFVTKVINAQETGALGVIVMDNDKSNDEYFVDMIDDLTKRNILIPAAFLHYKDGHLILNSINKHNLIGARINIPLNLTYNQMLNVHRAPGSYWL